MGALLLLGVAAVLGAFGYFWVTKPPGPGRGTYCPPDGPKTVTAVIVDATDAINATQRVAITNELAAVRGSVPRHGLLSVYSAGFNGEISRPLFSMCNPGTAAEVNAITEGTRVADRRFKEEFDKPLSGVLEGLLSAPPATKSPLLEAVQAVSVQTFGPLRAKGHGGAKKLILVSDLLQYSDALTLYEKPPQVESFLRTEAYRRIRADLRDVEVHVLLIRRQTKNSAQTPELMRFWEGVISAEGGRLVHFKPLEG